MPAPRPLRRSRLRHPEQADLKVRAQPSMLSAEPGHGIGCSARDVRQKPIRIVGIPNRRSDFLPAQLKRPHGRRPQDRESVSEYSSPCIDMRTRNARYSADPGVGRQLGRAVSRIIRFSVASGGRLDHRARITFLGALPAAASGRFVQGGALVVGRRWWNACMRCWSPPGANRGGLKPGTGHTAVAGLVASSGRDLASLDRRPRGSSPGLACAG